MCFSYVYVIFFFWLCDGQYVHRGGAHLREPHRKYIRVFQHSLQDAPLRPSAVLAVMQQHHEIFKGWLTPHI